MEVKAGITLNLKVDMTPEQYGQLIQSFNELYWASVNNRPMNLEAVDPLFQLKDAIVLAKENV